MQVVLLQQQVRGLCALLTEPTEVGPRPHCSGLLTLASPSHQAHRERQGHCLGLVYERTTGLKLTLEQCPAGRKCPARARRHQKQMAVPRLDLTEWMEEVLQDPLGVKATVCCVLTVSGTRDCQNVCISETQGEKSKLLLESENKILLVTKDVTVPVTAATSKGEPVSPQGTQEGNREHCHLAAIRLQPLLKVVHVC
ncbi:uncharacterized protein LOC106509653 isoform X2 [Sus scrofa]|uniref:uncharacterized protein LOC106509653 isoform X2 n=1 Tax=Sus scrofa TaxID=9823 RepID=UPI000A2B697E|nr:uncharacterized protein LOC106509653 isoform X2 [Sus scrofa]